MNKNEYYRFSTNLNAQIAVDEEKAKNGDVDAMVRLARYFRTGETIAFDYQNEEDVVGLWIKYEDEDGIVHTDLNFWEEYQADNTAFEKGKVYAQMAADKGDVRGFFQNHFYLLESVSRDVCYYELLKLKDELETYTNEALVRVKEGDENKYPSAIELDDGLFRNRTAKEIDNAHKRLVPQIRELECALEKIRESATVVALDNLLKSAESKYVPAQVEIAKYYFRGKSFFDNGNTPNQDDFDQAEKILLEASDTGEESYIVNTLLAKVYESKENRRRDDDKVLEYYAKANDWDSFLSAEVSETVLVNHLAEIITSSFYEKNWHLRLRLKDLSCFPVDIIESVANKLDGKNLIDLCAIILESPAISCDDNIDETQSYDKTAEFVYHILDEASKRGDSYAQYKLGYALQQRCHRVESDIVLKVDQCYLSENECFRIGGEWIAESANKGQPEAIAMCLMGYDECSLEDINALEATDTDNYHLLLFHTACKKEEAGDYNCAIICLKKLMEFHKTVNYANQTLKLCEKLDDGSAEEFVLGFLDWAIENQIKNEWSILVGDFVFDELIPRVLDKSSKYYNPSYAIRILQSSEFSTPEGYYKLGCIYSDGEHVEKNYKQALKYFKLAAKEDVGEAYYKLGYLYYYGDGGLNPEPLRAKEYFEKAIFCGINCEYAYEMVRADLNEKDNENPMKEYADLVIAETPRGAERNARFQDDMANEFGEYWEKLNENTRGFIYSGIKTYVNNYEDDDPIFDFSAAINPMAKSLETLLGDIFYTKYKQWLRVNGVSNIKEYFESLGARVSSDKDPFELGAFRFIAYERNAVNTDYETTRKLIRANKLPAIIRKSGKVIYKLQLHEKFAEYANEIFKEDAFSSDERMQEITAFIINLVSQVEVIREDLRNRASHDTVMKAMHAEKCGNILYKTKKLLYSLISKIKE